jgi:hypothetical protein
MAVQALQSQSLQEMKENVRRVVQSLDVCWRCQNVTECRRHVLGNLVLVWLCSGCLEDMDQLNAERPQRARRSRKVMV